MSSRKVLSVTEVTRFVSGMLKEYFDEVWVEGEVSGCRAYPSGHVYFTLKDEQSQLQAVCFRSAAAKLRFHPEDGLLVVAHGRLDLYAASGKLRMVADWMEPTGLGALQKAFEQLKRKLAAEGLFAEERKKPLPELVRTLGIVTSPAGAAIHDMLKTLRLHRARLAVLVYPAQVQGEGAAEQIAQGIGALNERGVECIIVGRGGGSLEDLWAFNEEVVARAIAGSGAPVISGVGHEVDFTIADFVADVRAATPTAAAQLVARPWEELEVRLTEAGGALVELAEQALAERERQLDRLLRDRAFEVVRRRLLEARGRVERAADSAAAGAQAWVNRLVRWSSIVNQRLSAQEPGLRLTRHRGRMRELVLVMERAALAGLGLDRSRFAQAAARLDTLSPIASLGRGYAVCQKVDGAVVVRVSQVRSGDKVSVRVSDGRLDCGVERTGPA
jgi:exodeoxyribonuclease VII large subunit